MARKLATRKPGNGVYTFPEPAVKYTPEVVDVVCRRIARGEFITDICADEGMPSRQTIYYWCRKYPEFREQYNEARMMQADEHAERAVIEATSADDPMGANIARLKYDALRWYAGVLKPSEYSSKQQVEHSGPGGGPMRVEAVTMNVDALSPEGRAALRIAMQSVAGGDDDE